MRQVKEALRLAAGGLSRREISRSLGIGHTTVQEYLERARRAGLSWPLPPELNEAELEERLFPKVTTAAAERPLPDWLAVHRDLRRSKHVTLKLIWLEYREVHPEGLGYTQFCTRYHEWLGRQDVVMRLGYPAGERMFVDFCGDTVPVVDRETGEIRQAQVFVATLGFSGYLYAEAFWQQDLESWLAAHTHAFEQVGGVTQLLVPDNLRGHLSSEGDPPSLPTGLGQPHGVAHTSHSPDDGFRRTRTRTHACYGPDNNRIARRRSLRAVVRFRTDRCTDSAESLSAFSWIRWTLSPKCAFNLKRLGKRSERLKGPKAHSRELKLEFKGPFSPFTFIREPL